jgi:hypothetical protein
VSFEDLGLVVELLRRDADACVLAVSGGLSLRSAGLVTGSLSKALADAGRVLVDVSGLRLTFPAAVRLFPSILAAAGGWPQARLVLFGADAELAMRLTALRVTTTVPLAPDEAGARLLLDERPTAVARQLHLERTGSSPQRARLFVDAACADWQLDAIRHDAVAVASELVANAVRHAGTECRLALRCRARGLTIAVYDRAPDRLPVPHPFDASEGMHGLFLVAALSLHWGVSRHRDEKCVWAFLPTAPAAPSATTYPGAVHAAVHEAVRLALAHGTNSADAAAAIRQLTARLAEQHGTEFLRNVAAELVVDLAETTSAIESQTGEIEFSDWPGPGAGGAESR